MLRAFARPTLFYSIFTPASRVFLRFAVKSSNIEGYSSPAPLLCAPFSSVERGEGPEQSSAKAFMLFWTAVTLDPREKRLQKYYRITLRTVRNTCFESSWGSGGFFQEAPRRSSAPYLNCNPLYQKFFISTCLPLDFFSGMCYNALYLVGNDIVGSATGGGLQKGQGYGSS